MDIPEKLRFINELIDNVKMDIVKKVPDMPEDWDGFELRWYITEKFKEQEIKPKERHPYLKKRHREYRNFVITTGNF